MHEIIIRLSWLFCPPNLNSIIFSFACLFVHLFIQPFIHLSQIQPPIHAFVRLLIYFFRYLLVFVCLLIYLLNLYKCLFSDSGSSGIVLLEDGTSEEAEWWVSIPWIKKQGSTCNHYYHNSVIHSCIRSSTHPCVWALVCYFLLICLVLFVYFFTYLMPFSVIVVVPVLRCSHRRRHLWRGWAVGFPLVNWKTRQESITK